MKQPWTYICLAGCLTILGPVPVHADWPAFRGPLGNGVVPASADGASGRAPLQWSETQHVTWKTPIPHSGLSTPVVMDGRVWLTTATLEGHDSFVLCLDARTGEVLLNKRLFHAEDPEPLGNKVNGYASPSPVVEAGRVYVSFGSYGTACLDTRTFDVLWSHKDLPCRHYRGPGSSPILFKDLLILTMDGVDRQYVAALNKMTGKTRWRTDRTADFKDLDVTGQPAREGDFRKAFATPLIVTVKGKAHMISAGSRAVYGYDPLSGQELWTLAHDDYSSSASPVFGQGLAYVLTGFGKAELFAMPANGRGSLSEEAIVWRTRKQMPRTPSPVLIDGLLFTLADNGTLTCLDAVTGQEVWRERLKGKFAASLLYANGQIYCVDQEGKTTVLKAGQTFSVLAENTLESGCMASPAVSGNALLLRTKTHLYRIE
ncbi:MAG: PQQ-binding-like beta-propeller repeat protein [Planctomycetes bacterium]|nr:PQQ-binding-like beta-propeller repeat protein [Planctomycetota bacterium]